MPTNVLVFLYISDIEDVTAERENEIANEIAFYMGSVRDKRAEA